MQDSQVPVLRWVFARDAERLQCELSLGHDRLLYELRTRRLGGAATERVDRYHDVSVAFSCQGDLERGLIDEGWSLEHYEKLYCQMEA